MGISFLYIGRDADTMDDVIKPDPYGIRMPLEMVNITKAVDGSIGGDHPDGRGEGLPFPADLPLTPNMPVRRTARVRRSL